MDPSRTIIDTDVLIDFLRNKKDAIALITKMEQENTQLFTTTVNAFELYYGAHKSRNCEKNLQATKKLLSSLLILPLTPKSAQKASHIYADLEASGQPIGLRDTFIAAIALTKGLNVATRNVEHFKKIRDLTIIT
jgi:tRNA(fMet)-specific endonuclease VapC